MQYNPRDKVQVKVKAKVKAKAKAKSSALTSTSLPRIIPKAPAFRLGMRAISNLKIKKSPVL